MIDAPIVLISDCRAEQDPSVFIRADFRAERDPGVLIGVDFGLAPVRIEGRGGWRARSPPLFQRGWSGWGSVGGAPEEPPRPAGGPFAGGHCCTAGGHGCTTRREDGNCLVASHQPVVQLQAISWSLRGVSHHARRMVASTEKEARSCEDGCKVIAGRIFLGSPRSRVREGSTAEQPRSEPRSAR